jgi:hypothetical protein
MLKRDSLGVSPAPNQDPALSAKVTTGGLSAPSPDGRQGATTYGLMGPDLLFMLHFLALMLRSIMIAIMAEKQKIVELITLSYLSLLVPSPMTKVIIWGKSGQPLECYFTWPLACSLGDLLFCCSFLIVPETPVPLLVWDLLSQLKAQILLPPGSYFCCPLLQEQIHSTVWTDEMSVGQARMALPIQITLKNPSQFPHPKQ